MAEPKLAKSALNALELVPLEPAEKGSLPPNGSDPNPVKWPPRL